jgi:hypothetical protein
MSVGSTRLPTEMSTGNFLGEGYWRLAREADNLTAVFPRATRGLEPISYRGALLNTFLHATVYVYTQFAE